MPKQFPKKLFVRIDRDNNADLDYFTADEDAASLVEMGAKVKLGVYQLIEITEGEGVAQFKKGSLASKASKS